MSATSNPEPATDKGLQPAGRSPGSDRKPWRPFTKALVATAAPLVIGSMAFAIIPRLTMRGMDRLAVMGGIFFLMFIVVVICLIVSLILAIVRRRELAGGILAGMGIGIVALGASCFSLLA